MRKPEEIIEKVNTLNLNKTSKRIDWHSKWLMHAQISSLRSHDARTKCGCIFVRNNNIVSEGYNGVLRGINDKLLPNYEYNKDIVISKEKYFLHAEDNCIINAARKGSPTEGCIAYITGYPCCPCYQKLWQAGIAKIYVPKVHNKPVCMQNTAHKEQFELLKYLTQYQLEVEEVEINLDIFKELLK